MKTWLCLLFLVSPYVFAGNIKVRAREHFEIHKIKFDSGADAKYSGFSNTLNLWYEVPYDYSIGFSVSPILGKLTAQDDASENMFGKKVNFKSYGIEAKYYPFSRTVYFRHGIYAHEFSRLSGWGGLTTVGYEHPFEKLGVALEAGQRLYSFGNEKGSAFNIAIGIHFYKL